MTFVDVAAEQPYRVTIANGAMAALSEHVTEGRRVAIIHPGVMSDRAVELATIVTNAGGVPTLIEVPSGEAAKTVTVLSRCWDELAESTFTRSDLVVGLGGGATTDMAGMVAATWLRGVDYISIPSTVLGMVDAAVGGKTGINIPAGKNLVGAFHEPIAVLCDLSNVSTLSAPEVSSGLAEVIKCGFIADPRILELVEQDPTEAQDVSSVRFAELVRRAIEVKAKVVTGDLKETNHSDTSLGREVLNYGHTLAHAIEASQSFTWRHGDAVAVGMVYAAQLSHEVLGLDEDVVQAQRQILASVNLPTTFGDASWNSLREFMSLDKKARGNTLRFVGLKDVAEPWPIVGPSEEALVRAYAAVEPLHAS